MSARGSARSSLVVCLALSSLQGLAACQANSHRENIEGARDALLGRGCALGGLESPSPPFSQCVEAARSLCKGRDGSAIVACAERIAGGQR